MITRRAFAALLPNAVTLARQSDITQAERSSASSDHIAWVQRTLTRMKTIKRGMTRKQLLTVFKTEGGLSTGLQRTFVNQDCPYFKVDVDFKAAGRPNKDGDGRVTLIEDPGDVILQISRPYLEFIIAD